MPWCLLCSSLNIDTIGHLLPGGPSFTIIEGLLWRVSLINFNSARNVAAVPSSSANAASLVIFMFFSRDLFLNLRNHPLLAVNSLLSLVLGIPCWSVLIGSVLSGGTHCHQSEHVSVHVLTYKFYVFSTLTKHLSCTVATVSAVWGTIANKHEFLFPSQFHR